MDTNRIPKQALQYKPQESNLILPEHDDDDDDDDNDDDDEETQRFFRHLLGITKLDKGKNQCIREETGAENIVKEIKQYQEKWLQHVQRMDTNRIPKQALQYKPKGRRHIGRPRKRWRDQFHFEDTRNRNQT